MKSLFPIAALSLLLLAAAAPGKPPIPTPRDTPMLGDLDHYLLSTLYQSKDPDTGLVALVGEPQFHELTEKHDLRHLGGPMLGCVTDTSARFWVRTAGPAKVEVVVGAQRSAPVTTGPEKDYIAILRVKDLQASTPHSYDVLVDGETIFPDAKPAFRTYPSKGQKAEFKVGFGGGARYNPPREGIWEVIARHDPEAFLFLGDNVYIDQPLSRTKQRVHYYRRQLRPEFQRLTASTAIYAIYDDHDLGKNDTAGGPHPFKPDWKFQSWKVFRENWNNPFYGGGEAQPGCWFDFSIGDVDFFMLDNRYYRAFGEGTMLGPVQKNWLLTRLKASTATFRVIASGTLWTEHADKGGSDSWWGVREEREELFSFIDRENIGGVILLSADRHRTDVYRIERPNGYDLYEFETSKLTNDHTHPVKKEALFSYNQGNFFGLLRFNLSQEDPEVTFQCITSEDAVVHEMTLRRSQLQAGSGDH